MLASVVDRQGTKPDNRSLRELSEEERWCDDKARHRRGSARGKTKRRHSIFAAMATTSVDRQADQLSANAEWT
jgi:hypothetical protein